MASETVIRTKYLKPTKTQGNRIKAIFGMYDNVGPSITIAYPEDCSSLTAHYIAIKTLEKRLGMPKTQWAYTSTDEGFIFVAR